MKDENIIQNFLLFCHVLSKVEPEPDHHTGSGYRSDQNVQATAPQHCTSLRHRFLSHLLQVLQI